MRPGDTACSQVRKLWTMSFDTLGANCWIRVAQPGRNVCLTSESQRVITARTPLPGLRQWWIHPPCYMIATSFHYCFSESKFCLAISDKDIYNQPWDIMLSDFLFAFRNLYKWLKAPVGTDDLEMRFPPAYSYNKAVF